MKESINKNSGLLILIAVLLLLIFLTLINFWDWLYNFFNNTLFFFTTFFIWLISPNTLSFLKALLMWWGGIFIFIAFIFTILKLLGRGW